jgi:hypothetical protein
VVRRPLGRGSDLLRCTTVPLPGGGTAIVCQRGARRGNPRCSYCDRPARYQCDEPVGPSATCDRWLCDRHRFPNGADVDHCPEHARQAKLAL